jgi:hypothetical protein
MEKNSKNRSNFKTSLPFVLLIGILISIVVSQIFPFISLPSSASQSESNALDLGYSLYTMIQGLGGFESVNPESLSANITNSLNVSNLKNTSDLVLENSISFTNQVKTFGD